MSFYSGDAVSDLRFKPTDISNGATHFRLTFHRACREPVVIEAAHSSRGGLEVKCGDGSSAGGEARKAFCGVLSNSASRIVYVPAKRSVGQLLHADEDKPRGECLFDGTQALALLLTLTNPSKETAEGAERLSERLHETERIFGRILGEPAEIRALPALRDIEVSIGSTSIALSRLGAGIEQILIFSLALATHAGALFLIEEPENFLHPTVQRRMLRELLAREAESVVTTHSNHLLDIRDRRVAYFRTFRKAGTNACALERIDSERKYSLLLDLGVKPSSLFESNAILWVEGPSDAIYLRAWLSLCDDASEIIEGLHYTFAFHAGALLDKFFIDWKGEGRCDNNYIVDLCSLHPNFFVMADRDAADGEYGHGYLERLAADPNAGRILWVSAGKEIENYLPVWLFERYLTTRASPRREVQKTVSSDACKADPFWKILNRIAGEDVLADYPNKVRFAEWASAELRSPPPGEDALDVLDLRAQLRRVVAFIKAQSDLAQ